MSKPSLNWSGIDTVLLDMDGTLLDQHFDDYFWQHHLPLRYAESRGLDLATAKAELLPRFRRIEGTLDWYCLDYWSRELGLELALLKAEIRHLIGVHPHVREFLDGVRRAGKTLALVTNAHMDALALKMEDTRLRGYFDRVIVSHELGLPKEEPPFWERLQEQLPFDRERTLLVDDSLPVLRSAEVYGIAHLLAGRHPSSQKGPKATAPFAAVASFADIIPPAAGSSDQ